MKILNQGSMFTINDKGIFVINVDVQSIRESGYLNFTGLVYSDQKYKVFKPIQNVFSNYAIVTDQDLISHDSYMDGIKRDLPIIFIINESPSSFNIDDKQIRGCSKKRIHIAAEKLKENGFTCVHITKSIKGAERLIKKAQLGTIERAATNVIKVKFGA